MSLYQLTPEVNKMSKRKIWIRVFRKDLDSQSNSESGEVYSYEISEGQTGENIKEEVVCKCDLTDLDNVVFKLRNHRGSLVPFTANLPSNSASSPYILEVVQVHQNIKAKPRSIKINSYSETMKEKVADILQRIEKLESTTPELDVRREAKINNEMKDVDQMLKFLSKRIKDAEQAHWQGMFKKNPLW